MSCMGNGYLSGNMLIAFPFEDDQCLNWGPVIDEGMRAELQNALQACFTDASVYIKAGPVPVSDSRWPAIGDFSIDGSGLSFSIRAGDAGAALHVAPSSVKFPIVSGNAEWGSYVVTMSSDGIRHFLSVCADNAISPPAQDNSSSLGREGGHWLRLCPKCITANPYGVTSIRVYDGIRARDSGPHFILSGNVLIKPGSNMQMSEPDDDVNGFELNAIPGAGMGVVPCECDSAISEKSPYARLKGHVKLLNDTCYDFEPKEKYGAPGKYIQELVIHGKCTACCTCEMYADMVNRLAELADRVRRAKKSPDASEEGGTLGVDDIFQKYEDAVEAFNIRMSMAKLEDVSLTLSGMPVGANISPKLSRGKVTGRMERCAFTAILRNSSYFKILATVNSMSGSDSIVEASVAWSDDDGSPLSATSDSKSGVVGMTYSVCPGRSLAITFISTKSRMTYAVSTGGFTGSVSLGLSYVANDGTIKSLGSLNKTVEV